jgi:FkbH-like protein
VNLIDALEIIKEPHEESAPLVRVFLGCGFTPLHLGTFLAAHLRNLNPSCRVEWNSGLFGDLIGSLERLRPEEHDALAVVIEWPDLDSRLGLRTLGGWQAEILSDIVATVGQSLERLLRALQRISEAIPTCVCLPTLPLPPLFYIGTQQTSFFELSLRRNLASFAEAISDEPRVSVVSDQYLNHKSPLSARFDLRTEIKQGFPYKTSHASALGEIFASLLFRRKPKKGLITDLDDTLWAGIVGEVGVEGIHWHLEQDAQLHGIYQQFLASLASAGTLIGAASKNDADLVERAFERNDMLLSKASVFPIEANWRPKSESIQRILKTWNVLAESVVFVDDSPMEVAEVQKAFPEMECILFPKNDYSQFWGLLLHLRERFAKAAITEEDSLRLQSIRGSGSFSESVKGAVHSVEDFLLEAAGRLTFNLDKPIEDMRAFELVNKTNQFNLNGRRYDEIAWSRLLRDPQASILTVSYEDKFGKLGRIGLLIGREAGKRFVVESWVMSCRAFSRRIEFHCLQYLFDRFAVDDIVFEVQETGRNGPLLEFLHHFVDGPLESGLQLSRSRFFLKTLEMPHQIIERVTANG